MNINSLLSITSILICLKTIPANILELTLKITFKIQIVSYFILLLHKMKNPLNASVTIWNLKSPKVSMNIG